MKGFMEPAVRQAIFPLWVRRGGHADREGLGKVHQSYFLSKFEIGAFDFKNYLHYFVIGMENFAPTISTVRSVQDLTFHCHRKAGSNGGSAQKRWVCTRGHDKYGVDHDLL